MRGFYTRPDQQRNYTSIPFGIVADLEAYIFNHYYVNLKRYPELMRAKLQEALDEGDLMLRDKIDAVLRHLPPRLLDSAVGSFMLVQFSGVVELDEGEEEESARYNSNLVLNGRENKEVHSSMDITMCILSSTENIFPMAKVAHYETPTSLRGELRVYSFDIGRQHVRIDPANLFGFHDYDKPTTREVVVSSVEGVTQKAVIQELYSPMTKHGDCGWRIVEHVLVKLMGYHHVDIAPLLQDPEFVKKFPSVVKKDNRVRWNVLSIAILIQELVRVFDLPKTLLKSFGFWYVHKENMTRLRYDMKKLQPGKPVVNNNSKRKLQCTTHNICLYNEHWYIMNQHLLNKKVKQYKQERVPCPVGCGLQLARGNVSSHTRVCSGVREEESVKYDLLRELIPPLVIPSLTRNQFRERAQEKLDWLVQRVLSGNHSVVIGGGGMGKTHMIQSLVDTLPGGIILAPTAQAASNYKHAYTWHSYFGYKGSDMLNFEDATVGNNADEDVQQLSANFQPDNPPVYIVIDEVSMVTGRDLSKMHRAVCEKLKCRDGSFFGGIPVILVGDPVQLPPVQPDVCGIDFWFCYNKVRSVILSKGYVQLLEPFRYLDPTIGDDEVDEKGIEFANLLERLRCGEPPIGLIQTYGGRMTPNDLDNYVLQTGEVVICALNSQVLSIARSLMKSTPVEETWTVYSLKHRGSMVLYKGLDVIVSNNRCVSRSDVHNGTKGVVISVDLDSHVTIQVGDECVNIPIQRRTIGGRRVHAVELVYGRVMTVHRSQGCTFDKVIIAKTTPNHKKTAKRDLGVEWSPGQMYVAISRVRTPAGLKFMLSESCCTVEFFRRRAVFSVLNIAKRFALQPTRPIPSNVIFKGDFLYNQDTTLTTAAYTVPDIQCGKAGKFHDHMMTANDKLLQLTIFFDIETKCDMERDEGGLVVDHKLEWLCVCARLYYAGQILSPHELLAIWRKDFELESADYFVDIPSYRVTESGSLYWSMESPLVDNMDVCKSFFESILQLMVVMVTIQSKYKVHGAYDESQPTKRHHLLMMSEGIRLCGYNSNNFDNFGILQEVLCSSTLDGKLQCNITPGCGTSTKGFAIFVKPYNLPLIRSHDLIEMIGPVSLANSVRDFVQPLLGAPEKILSKTGLLTLFERAFFDNQSPVDGSTVDDIEQLQKVLKKAIVADVGQVLCKIRVKPASAKKHQKIATFVTKSFPRLCDAKQESAAFWYHWAMQSQKKGCPPLKWFQEMSKEEYISLGMVVLEDVCNGQRERLFFKRELCKVEDTDMLRPYRVHEEIREYCEQDVLLTEAVYRVYNNALYYLAEDEYKHPSGLHGLRRSVLDFTTLAELSELVSVSLFPPDLRMTQTCTTVGNVVTKLPLYTIDQAEQFRSIPGGKVIPRQIMWSSTDGGAQDYCLYLDSSGMYMSAMMRYEYPYGMFRKRFYTQHTEEMELLRADFMSGKGMARCRFMYVTRSLHPMEIEPVAGYRGIDQDGFEKVMYSNEPCNTWETNVSLADIVQAGGIVHRIWYCMEWEKQADFLSRSMKVYDRCKNQSTGAQRSLYKGIANRTYGVQLKKDTYSRMRIVRDMKDLAEIFATKHVDAFIEVDNGVAIRYSDDISILSARCSHMGSFVLTYSRHDQNQAIQEAYGEDRFNPAYHKHMIRYGDTDSLIMDVRHVQRLIESDRRKGTDWDARRVFLPEVPLNDKAGKLTDELADDINKYIPKDQAAVLLQNGFPDISTGFCGRVVENVSPRPKCSFVKVLFPPAFLKDGVTPCDPILYEEDMSRWHVAYKVTCKGIPRGCLLYLEGDVFGVLFEPTEACYELFKRAVSQFLPVRCVAKERLKKLGITLSQKEKLGGIVPFDIQNIKQLERCTLKSVWMGRSYVAKKTPGEGKHFQDIYESYTLPHGYQEEGYDEKTIEDCYRIAKEKVFY